MRLYQNYTMEGSFYYFENSHYFIERVGESYSIGIEFPTFNTKLIMNENLRCSAYPLELNPENLNNLLGFYDEFKNIKFDNLDMYNYIIYNSQIIKIENWKDMFSFIKRRMKGE